MKFDRIVLTLQVYVLTIIGTMFFPNMLHCQQIVHSFQTVLTAGAGEWESFTINDDTFLAVANHRNDTTYSIDSKIYRWNGSLFVEMQSIPTHGAIDLESFTINDETFLAVANHRNSSTFNIDSKIYRWNGALFVEMQSIPTHSAYDFESFTINDETFLAVANYRNGSTSFSIDSKIYKWNGSLFVEIQSIPTHGAIDLESFTINGDIFLAIANHQNAHTHNIDSKIYRWNGSLFVEIQSISTHGAFDFEDLNINDETFLAVANYRNGSTFNIDSKIYRWNGEIFVETQTIPTVGATDWESFTIGDDSFLALANNNNGTTRNLYSKIYQWAGSSFVEVQSIPTVGAVDWESFSIGNDFFLAVASITNDTTWQLNSEIFKKEAPLADAGVDLLAFNPVNLDGSGSFDATGGHIVRWQWNLSHQTDSDYDRLVSGEKVLLKDLEPGFYEVSLTITDNDGYADTDKMTLGAIGTRGDVNGDNKIGLEEVIYGLEVLSDQ